MAWNPPRLALPATLLLVGAALVGTIYLASSKIIEYASTKAALDHVAVLIRVHDLVHRLQAERGLSVGVLTGRDEQLPELAAARTRSDAELAALDRLAVDVQDRARAAGLADSIAVLSAHTGLRQAIDRRQLSSVAAFARYSEIIDRLLTLGDRQVRRIDDVQLQTDGGALAAFARAKEAAGRERAILNRAYISGRFVHEDATEIALLAGMQEAYLMQFESLANGRTVAAYVAGRNEAFRDTERLRQHVLSDPKEALRIDSGIWFATATAKIDWMKIIEDQLAREIERRALDIAARTRADLVWNLALGLLIVTATVVLALAPFGLPMLRPRPAEDEREG